MQRYLILCHKTTDSSFYVCFLSGLDVKCIDVQDDIDETQFLVHPVAPWYLKLKMLKGTPDYEMGKGMIEAFIEAADSCNKVGKYGLALYPWLSAKDHETMVSLNEKIFKEDPLF